MSFLRRLFKKDDSHSDISAPRPENAPQLGTDQSVCPYCHHALEPKLKRQKKCPHCANIIYVRKGYLLTEEDKQIHDSLDRLSALGITLEIFQRERKQLSKQFGTLASINDTIWRILNAAVTTDRAGIAYFLMADLARGEGKDPRSYQAEAQKVSLLGLKRQGVRHVQVYTANDDHVCHACRSLAKKTISIDEALSEMPLPHRCTSDVGCRCWYGPVL